MTFKPENGSPCAACKKQRKKCTDSCQLAPHFPQSDSSSFALVHKVFGTGNVIKLLERVPLEKRQEAVRSMIFEAKQRTRNPVGGCMAIIEELQNQVSDLESRLAAAEARLRIAEVLHADTVSTDSYWYPAEPLWAFSQDASEGIVTDDYNGYF